MLPIEQRHEALYRLAKIITRSGLHAPVSIILETLRPLDVISSQMVLFLQPFMFHDRWEQYAHVLSDETSWQELRHLLSRQDS